MLVYYLEVLQSLLVYILEVLASLFVYTLEVLGVVAGLGPRSDGVLSLHHSHVNIFVLHRTRVGGILVLHRSHINLLSLHHARVLLIFNVLGEHELGNVLLKKVAGYVARGRLLRHGALAHALLAAQVRLHARRPLRRVLHQSLGLLDRVLHLILAHELRGNCLELRRVLLLRRAGLVVQLFEGRGRHEGSLCGLLLGLLGAVGGADWEICGIGCDVPLVLGGGLHLGPHLWTALQLGVRVGNLKGPRLTLRRDGRCGLICDLLVVGLGLLARFFGCKRNSVLPDWHIGLVLE